ncbi:hypothetical protein F0562_000383 [Nyssa sinensis]|uniref:Uncharacterized protein n=1 Tax=Nyssa sinensis TaxID=561372 RepID=A0A5J5C0F8_9ASTE|nr:hypothetical protein F0562_000383 [Nyssa sinensis]
MNPELAFFLVDGLFNYLVAKDSHIRFNKEEEDKNGGVWHHLSAPQMQSKSKTLRGMYLTSQPIGQDMTAIPIHAPHCPQFNRSVFANFFRNSTITT